MAIRTRLIIDTEDVIRLAVRLAANKVGQSPSEWLNDLLRKTLSREIEDAKKYTPKKKPDQEST